MPLHEPMASATRRSNPSLSPHPSPQGAGAWRDVSLFGLTMRANIPFATPLAEPQGAPELTFERADHPPIPAGWNRGEPVYESLTKTPGGAPALQIYRLPQVDVMHFPDVADFYCHADRIVCNIHQLAAKSDLVEAYFLGDVMNFWMERSGLPMLHASAVAIDGVAIAFLADSQGGKSSLAASFVQAGNPLLTDDLLPLEATTDGIVGRPGYPCFRLWPDLARHFAGDLDKLKRVNARCEKRRVPVGPDGFGRFVPRPLSLARIYLPDRQANGPIAIAPMRSAFAIAELANNSFNPRLVNTLGWQVPRLAIFARLLRHTPLRRLSYPSGLEHLDAVRDAIHEDLRQPEPETRS